MYHCGCNTGSLPYLPHPEDFLMKVLQAIIGTILVGFASGIYLIANLGPGPRDGLMTGFQRVSGLPIAWVRAFIELTIISVGWTLGGTIGLATLILLKYWARCFSRPDTVSAISKK